MFIKFFAYLCSVLRSDLAYPCLNNDVNNFYKLNFYNYNFTVVLRIFTDLQSILAVKSVHL
jgi:hypothetical protein